MPVINRRVQGQIGYLENAENVEMFQAERIPGDDNNTSEEDSNMLVDDEEIKQEFAMEGDQQNFDKMPLQ